jgi:RNA polymerase sigma-70 factor (ECF subfamily)
MARMETPNVETQKLLQSLASGEVGEAEMSALYETVSMLARHYARHYGLDESDAEDVSTETVTALVGSVTRREIPSNLVAFLTGAVRNRLWQRIREKRSERDGLAAVEAEFRVREQSRLLEHPSDEAAELADKTRAVQNAMATLSDRERALLLMRFFEELSIVEIAKRTDSSSAYVKMLLYRALQRLRKALEMEQA